MTTQMIIRLEKPLKNSLCACAAREGKNASQVLRELMENYIKDRDMSFHIDELWKRVGAGLKKRRKTVADVTVAIAKSRQDRKQ